MAPSEPGPEEREQQLGVLRKRMRRAARRGDAVELEQLSTQYAELKAVHVARSHEEGREAARVRAAARRAQEARVRPQRWRLPAGFGVSPLAAQRAREARPGWVVPVGRPALSPWRRGGGLMSETIWRP
jgi:hypothetical protein